MSLSQESLPASHPGGRRSGKSRFPRSWWMVMTGMFAAVLVMYVHTVMQEANLNRMKKDIDALREMTIKDRMHLEMVRNPQVIDQKAVLIGMKQPQEVVYVKKPLVIKPPATNPLPPRRPVIQEGY
jgi:hypothetical protein